MIAIATSLLLTLLPGSPARAVPSAAAPVLQEDDLAAAFAELDEAFEKAALRWRIAKRKADREEQDFAEPHPVVEYYPRFEELAVQGEGRALLWTGLNVQDLPLPEDQVAARKRAAFGSLVEGFADRDYMEDFLRKVDRQDAWLQDEELITFLEAVYERNPDDELRATAGYKAGQRYERMGGDATDRAEAWYRKVIADFPDSRLAEKADARLVGLSVAVGKIAPDLEMEDVDGTPFRLSDYRGKVVVLDFWGFW